MRYHRPHKVISEAGSMSWSDQVVLITGASSGIGRGLAIELARRGAKLGLVARRAGLLDEIVSDLDARKRANALTLPADVEDPQSVRGAAERLISQFGRIDLLIANA